MAVTETVKEAIGEWKEDLKQTVHELTEEVRDLKGKVKNLLTRRRDEHQLTVQASPSDPFTALQSQMNRLFDQFPSRWPGWGEDWLAWPKVDVTESDKELRIRAELPGIDRDDIDLTLDDNTLFIRGQKHHEQETNQKDRYHYECRYGSFNRMIPLPCAVDADQLTAKFRRGVLTIRVPKVGALSSRGRKIVIDEE